MKRLILIILILLPINLLAEIHTTEDWMAKYLSKCPKTPNNLVCYDKTKRNLKRMLNHKKILFRYLDKHNLPRWLSTICVIESECTENAISKAGAVGMFQVMPFIIQHYLTKTRIVFGTEHRTRPTLKKSKKIGLDAEDNIKIAVMHLKVLYDKYGKDSHKKVVQAYNAGEFRVDCQNPKSKRLIQRCKIAGIFKKPLKPETLNYFFQLMALQKLMDGYNEYFVG